VGNHLLKSPVSKPSSKIGAAKTGWTERTADAKTKVMEKTITIAKLRDLSFMLLSFSSRSYGG
jgi:hypothetical protein